MDIIQRSVTALVPYAKNTKDHPKDQVARIAASIEEFGFNQPVLVDGEGCLVAGHGRVLDTVPTICVDHLTPEQVRAYRIADNKTAESAWIDDVLREELEELRVDGFDLSIIGFDDEEFAGLLEAEEVEGNTDPDAIPEVPEEPVCVLGDVWQLGRHRLMCGDSTDINAVETLMDGAKADMVFTDPPYGINFEPQRGTHGKILNDALDDNKFNSFLDSVFYNCDQCLKDDTYVFVWTGWPRLGTFERALKKVFKIQAFHFWLKNNFGIGYYSRPKHEPFYLCLKGKPVKPNPVPADVWEYAKVHKTIHSCEKPVGLLSMIMDAYHKNSLVVDLFGGSGSTLIACEQTVRTCYGMELDPRCCDVIIKRWEAFTGLKATKIEGRA